MSWRHQRPTRFRCRDGSMRHTGRKCSIASFTSLSHSCASRIQAPGARSVELNNRNSSEGMFIRRIGWIPIVVLALALLFPARGEGGTFTFTGSMNHQRNSHTATLLNSGLVLVAGGEGSISTAELYNPSTGNFTATGSLNTGRYWH